MAGMPDTDTESQEVLATQLRDKVTQTVVPAVTTVFFQPHRTRRQIEIIMRYEDAVPGNPVKTGQRGNRLATAVHKVHGFLQPAVRAANAATRRVTFVLALGMKCRAVLTGDRIHKPEPGIMPGLFVLAAGISESGNQLYSLRHTPGRLALATGLFAACSLG